MTFIAVRCPYCRSNQVVKRGKTRRGKQCYLYQNTTLEKRCWHYLVILVLVVVWSTA